MTDFYIKVCLFYYLYIPKSVFSVIICHLVFEKNAFGKLLFDKTFVYLQPIAINRGEDKDLLQLRILREFIIYLESIKARR